MRPHLMALASRARTLASDVRVRIGAIGLTAVAVIGIAVSAGSPPNIPSIPLAAEPLYARGARAKPTLTLALSVEFPTVGAQYVGTPGATIDATYASTTEYIGYFDAESCYTYNNNADATLRRFDRSGPATARQCGGTGFSGNFMNWATSSAIDILRFGLTGGDRVVDTAALTVLQRAYLPTRGDNNPGNFFNGSNFPGKRITNAVAVGAVPSTLLGTHTGDLWVANCRNRVHFGTTQTGNCDAPGANSNLGVPVGGASSGPVTNYSGALPAGFSAACANENGTCSFAGILQVAYGANSSWKFMSAKDGTACTNGVFGDPISGTVKKCYTRPDPTGWAPPGGTALSADGFFYSRVAVCGTDGSGVLTDPRTDLCLRYPNGNYKPVGNLQKYSDRVRVAAFGYLLDNRDPAQRNGAVLRAPMKYVGAKHYDANFSLVSGANPNQEWDTSTGVFVANPDAAAEGKSGVTNYLNQFGRTAGPDQGNYKRYDNVGELYYEALRYVQGLPPTPSAVSGVTAAMKDGFAAYTSWTDPHPAVANTTDYSCVRNNIVAIGDVNTWNDKTVPGNTRADANDSAWTASIAANEPDFMAWTKVVGAFESNRTEVSYLDGKGVNRYVSNHNAANTARWGMENQNIGASGASYYMAGIAYWANTHDIRGTDWSEVDKRRPGMRVTTYVLDVNEYGQQTAQSVHKNNQFFLAAKYGGFKDASLTGNPFKAADGTSTNLNWESTTTPGDAKNYYLSSSARGVLTALNEIFENIAKEANSIAGGAISTQRLTSVGGFIFQAQFDPADWSGDLIPYPVTLVGTSDIAIGDADAAPWKAAAKLDAKPPGNRKIFVGKASLAAVAATEFKWTSLTADTKEFLRAPSVGAALDTEAVGETRLDFLRGVRTQEAPLGTMRKRGRVLGDIVNSGVAYSGAPSLRIADAGYLTDFANDSTYKDRAKVLFVGANDGMLHAFNSADGDELFAYIPSWVVPRLSALTSPAYSHQAYVDASPVVAEAKVGSAWKTVLVGGTGGGGQGVYALDVSNPSAFDENKVMWEFTDRDDASLGNVVGRPAILKFRTGTGATDYKYFAVVAGGVNSYVDDGNYSNGNAAIFLLDLAKPANSAWVLGSNYYKIELPTATTTMASGIANFTTRSGLDDAVTQMFAGDMQGNVWKLSFAGKAPGDWTIDKLSFYKSGSTPIPMYVAKDGSGNRQPITMQPFLAYSLNRTTIVAFGTGKYLETNDNSGPFRAQSVYAVLDDNTAKADTAESAIGGRSWLRQATASTAGTITNSAFTWGRPSADTDLSLRAGWYFDMPSSATTGERQISPFTAFGGKVYSGTVIPPQTSCEIGSGRSYEIDLFSGSGSSLTSDVGILGEPFVLAVGSDALTKSNSTGQAVRTTQGRIVLQGSGSLKNSKGAVAVADVYRMSWRQINNYQEVRAAP